jgi:hypothetical protein
MNKGNDNAEHYLRKAKESSGNGDIVAEDGSEAQLTPTPPGEASRLDELMVDGGKSGIFSGTHGRAIADKNHELKIMTLDARVSYLNDVLDAQLTQSRAFLSGQAKIVAQEINEYVSDRLSKVYATKAQHAQDTIQDIVLATNAKICEMADRDEVLDDLKQKIIASFYKEMEKAVSRIEDEDRTLDDK